MLVNWKLLISNLLGDPAIDQYMGLKKKSSEIKKNITFDDEKQ